MESFVLCLPLSLLGWELICKGLTRLFTTEHRKLLRTTFKRAGEEDDEVEVVPILLFIGSRSTALSRMNHLLHVTMTLSPFENTLRMYPSGDGSFC